MNPFEKRVLRVGHNADDETPTWRASRRSRIDSNRVGVARDGAEAIARRPAADAERHVLVLRNELAPEPAAALQPLAAAAGGA